MRLSRIRRLGPTQSISLTGGAGILNAISNKNMNDPGLLNSIAARRLDSRTLKSIQNKQKMINSLHLEEFVFVVK